MSEQPPTYVIGQIVNGHRWTGTVWEPVAAAPGATAVAAPPVSPTKKPLWKRWWFWVIAVILLFIIIGAVGGGGGNSPAGTGPEATTAPTAGTPAEEPSAPAEEPAEEPGSDLAGLNTPVADGKFEFTVTKVKCGVESVGPDSFEEKAQGQFCLISITVKNVGDEAQTLFDSNQIVFDKDQRKYEADTAAGLYANEDSSVFIEEINPGNSIEGILVFDMPENVKPAVIELHDSAFSGGVQVSLT